VRVEETVLVRAPRARVWEALSDFDAYPAFMAGVTRWKPQGRRRRGLGARCDVRFQVGSTQVGGLIEVVEADEGYELAWVALTGVEHRGRWRLRDAPGGTDVTLRITYHTAGWPWGFLADAASSPLVRSLVRRSLDGLQRSLRRSRRRAARAG
jgi:uncharacterized membrane protein